MKVYMLANEPKAWIVTMKGPYLPMKVVGENEVPKEEVEWKDEDLGKIMINKAINMLQCALNLTEFNRVSGRDMAKEMWDKLEVTHEGTSQVKEQAKSKDLNTLKLDDLIGKLMTYEMDIQVNDGVEVVEKKKNVTFKANNQKEESEDDACDGEDIYTLISTKVRHYRNECPQLKKGEKKDKKSMKKKAFAATWSDDETSSTASESSLENGVANLCFMAQENSYNDEEVCLVSKMKNKWYLDSGCSRDMMGDPSQFSSLMPLDGGTVTFGDNGKGIVKGIGEIDNKSISFDDVWYMDGLKHNLLSISQLCGHMLSVVFFKSHCKIIDSRNDKVLFVGKRLKNVYVIDLHDIDANICLASITHDDTWLWHERLGNASMSVISKLLKHNLVDGLPKVNVNIDGVCDACMKGKQTRVSFKTKNCISTNRPLELLHMDLFGPMRILSNGGKSYVLVVVDDYSRFTWVAFLAHRKDALDAFKSLCKKLQNEKGFPIVSIRSDHEGEFENNDFENFCIEHGIDHNFLAPRTSQQNGVVE
ncbi:hypothetical protein SLEP1_g55729 [Rubroshorea leprosula]|uniref:Integrase catalytic domain-containing protein n=1 Tax=Rubroshorea leprosula TaxID=152421 RepID=A0AAV5MGE5_9ROSI|nr:hypothetical protein SLEP1_g55729 [Rubroshorea leprosula]